MIGIIGGGNMGEALVQGLLKNDKKILVCEIDENRISFLKQKYNINITKELDKIINSCNIIIFAIKPQIIDEILDKLKKFKNLSQKLFISIAAGVKIEKFENFLGKNIKIVRVMPNACAFVLESMSALSPNKNIEKKDLETAIEIFNSIGKTVIVSEKEMDAITALSGSGPGYVALILEAFSDAGVNVGLNREIANKLIVQTFKGVIKLFEESEKSFIEIKNMVTSPGGTTIAGIHELEKGCLKGTIMNCIEKAYERSKKLS